MTILVTGGLGYIGSHTVVQLLNAGYEVIIIDNLTNSKLEVLSRINHLSNSNPIFINGDIRDRVFLSQIFSKYFIDSVIHFAGLKSVKECFIDPLAYYDVNVAGCISLLNEMNKAGVHTFLYSSSATVYGNPVFLPYSESHPLNPINPYGQSKLMAEQIIEDFTKTKLNLKVVILRYFNPVGAHPSGKLGEDPNSKPNNIMPFISQVAIGKLPRLTIFGNDYDTIDGTGVRDYIHVVDLANGHLSALNFLKVQTGIFKINLGTGTGTSVLQLIQAFEKVSGEKIPYVVTSRRIGDLPEYFAKVEFAKSLLGWSAKFNIEDMCADSWRWQSQNPNGYSL